MTRRQGHPNTRGWAERLPVGEFKVCELCSSLNIEDNPACFCCGWGGRFDHDPASIETRFRLILDWCPDLVDLILEPPVPTWRDRLRSSLRRWRRLGRPGLDVRA